MIKEGQRTIVKVLINGYLQCPKCKHIDDAVERGGILDGVFCCDFMQPIGKYVEMPIEEWREKREILRGKRNGDWEKEYKVFDTSDKGRMTNDEQRATNDERRKKAL